MIRIGISGWTYDGWRGTFYPPKLAHSKELGYASKKVSSIEINGTFYSLQSPKSYSRWFESTPDDFIFSVKANRYITHFDRLENPEIPMANFFASGILGLKEKLGPILWQFPPSFSFEPDKLEHFFKLLPRDQKDAIRLAKKNNLSLERTFMKGFDYPMKHAMEIRNHSFLNPWFIELLRDYGVALVFADSAGKFPYMEDVTSDFIYIRLHGESELYVSGYDDDSLNLWKKRMMTWHQGIEPDDKLTISELIPKKVKRDVYIYFDNDAKIRAPFDAMKLMEKISNG